MLYSLTVKKQQTACAVLCGGTANCLCCTVWRNSKLPVLYSLTVKKQQTACAVLSVKKQQTACAVLCEETANCLCCTVWRNSKLPVLYCVEEQQTACAVLCGGTANCLCCTVWRKAMQKVQGRADPNFPNKRRCKVVTGFLLGGNRHKNPKMKHDIKTLAQSN